MTYQHLCEHFKENLARSETQFLSEATGPERRFIAVFGDVANHSKKKQKKQEVQGPWRSA